MVFDKSLALMFSLMILGQAYLVRRSTGTWLFPACMFGLFWFVFTFLPLAILFWVPVNPSAIAFIFLCTSVFSLSSIPFDWKTAFRENVRKRETVVLMYGNPFLKRVFYLSTLAALILLVIDLYVQGFSLHDLITDLQATALAYAGLVYSESLTSTVFIRSAIVCIFLATILGGFLFPCVPAKAERYLIAVLSFLPSTFVAITQTGKGLLFLSVVFFYSGLLVHRVFAGKLRLFDKSITRVALSAIPVLIVVVAIAITSRNLSNAQPEDELVGKLTSYVASYSFGHLYAFSDWFAFVTGGHSQFSYPHEGTTYGFYTFMSLFQLLGSHKVVPMGIFNENYIYGDLIESNIYTAFRGLVLDFGFVGCLLFLFLTGIMFHKTFHLMLLKRKPVFTVAAFVFTVECFYYSFIVSAMTWNRTLVAFCVLWLVLAINKRIALSNGRHLTSMPRLEPS